MLVPLQLGGLLSLPGLLGTLIVLAIVILVGRIVLKFAWRLVVIATIVVAVVWALIVVGGLGDVLGF